MDFFQKDRLFEVHASFSDNFLEYRMKRDRHEVHAFIPYTDLSNDLQGITEMQRILMPLAAFHFLGFMIVLNPEGQFHSPILAAILAAGVPVYGWLHFRMRYKLLWLKGEKHNLIVLNDAKGRAFLEEVRKRRREYLKVNYGSINWENTVETELTRFRWLNIQGALSDAEFENLRATLFNK